MRWFGKKEPDQEKRTAEEMENASINEARLAALVELSIMNDASVEELVDYSLERLVQLTKSEFGYVALVNEEDGTITMQAWSKGVLEKCGDGIPGKRFRIEETGLWRECLKQRKPIIANDINCSEADDQRLPEGYASIRRHLNVPIFENGSIVAVAGAANKLLPYDNTDVMQLSLLANGMWKVLQTRLLNEEIKKLAYYDFLTNLPNRVLLIDLLMDRLEDIRFDKLGGALLFIDVDNFKIVNDNFGHTYGDILLMDIAERMKAVTDPCHTIARIGGDEFVVLYDMAADMEEIRNYAHRLVNELTAPFKVGANDFYVTASIGIALFPKDGSSVDELMKSADMAMYSAKAAGKNTFCFYDQSMNDIVIQKLVMESSLRHALGNNEFLLHYQPQINLATGRITGFEALIRWNRPGSTLIYPGSFIHLAEESGMISPIGEWVLRTACCFGKSLHSKGFKNMYMSVNVSSVQLMKTNFLETVRNIIEETGFPSGYLELEITESVLMESFDACIAVLEELVKTGVKISLDDFGSKYSSLNYLKRLPISTLKIDKTFIDDICCPDKSRILTGSIVMLAHRLGLKVIAEGVETEEQLEYLRENGCDMVQGYLTGKPVDAVKIAEMLDNIENIS
jgi:diguanylate cyclase (GGDEF)-like protein